MENLKFIDEEFEEEQEEKQERERFKVTDLQSAEWVLKKLKYIKSQYEEQQAYIKSEKDNIKTYEEKIEAKYQDDKAFFESLLQEYVDARVEEDPKFKLKTMSGTASYGKDKQDWIYDEEALLKDLKDKNLNDFIKVSEKVNKVDLKKALTIAGDVVVDANGEVIDGIKIETHKRLNIKY